MKRNLLICIFCLLLPVQASYAFEKTRLIIMADMGNEPDEEQQMMHMLMYSNMFDLEGLIACSGKYLHDGRDGFKGKVHPELFHKLIDGYEKVVGNLKKHASGWPEPDYLRSIVKAGTAQYGIAAVAEGNSTDASRLIEAAILQDDPRKLYLVANAGTNSLAQALVDLDKTRSKEQMDALCKKLIVFENGAQDNSGAWIANKYPEIAWHRSNKQTYCYGGPGGGENVEGPYTWEPFPRTAAGQGEWSHQHIQTNHGALGAPFPRSHYERLALHRRRGNDPLDRPGKPRAIRSGTPVLGWLERPFLSNQAQERLVEARTRKSRRTEVRRFLHVRGGFGRGRMDRPRPQRDLQ